MQILNLCKNNPEKSSAEKVGEHIPYGYSMFTIWKFDGIEDNHDKYIGEDYIEKFCESLRKHAMKIINFQKNRMIPLTRRVSIMS